MNTKVSSFTPGRDKQGNCWFECGCMINGVMSKQCPLHAAAPTLLSALNSILTTIGPFHQDTVQESIKRIAEKAISIAEGGNK